jgi:anti-sigma regulatory factor (Ser/Thr protein kinase)
MTSLTIPMTDSSRVGEARREAALLAGAAGIGEVAAGKLALLVTELGTNLFRHAQEGEMLLHRLGSDGNEKSGVEVLAIDRGPGMTSVAECMRDGYSTGGTNGVGLGAVMRAASVFDIHSHVGRGTLILARVYAAPRSSDIEPAPSAIVVGGVAVPYPGQTECGDSWAHFSEGPITRVVVADGLGHGPEAAVASRAATDVFRRNRQLPLTELLARCHEALAATRGAAMAVAEIDRGTGVLRYAGVGNIAGVVLGGLKDRGLASHNGTVGQHLPRAQVFEHEWPADGALIMSSDGIVSRWSLDDYVGIRAKHPSLVAGLVYRDFSRKRDDTTVVVARATGHHG